MSTVTTSTSEDVDVKGKCLSTNVGICTFRRHCDLVSVTWIHTKSNLVYKRPIKCNGKITACKCNYQGIVLHACTETHLLYGGVVDIDRSWTY